MAAKEQPKQVIPKHYAPSVYAEDSTYINNVIKEWQAKLKWGRVVVTFQNGRLFLVEECITHRPIKDE